MRTSASSPHPAVPSRRAARLTRVFLTAALLLPGCRRDSGPSLGEPARVAQHPNGLAVGLAPGYDAQQTANGFLVSQTDSEKRRVPIRATVELTTAAPATPQTFPRFRLKDWQRFHYDVQHGSGGSGGDEYVIRIWTTARCATAPQCYIVVREQTQSEYGEPSGFPLAWSLAAHARLKE